MIKFSTVLTLFLMLLFAGMPFQDDVKTYRNLEARKTDGSSTFFSFTKNDIVSESEAWDLDFNRTTIKFKGMYTSMEKAFEQVKEVPQNKTFISGNENPIKDWYEYDSGSHTIYTIPNKVYLFRSADGKTLIKFQVLSYYKDAPEHPQAEANDPGFYTFRYQKIGQ